MCTKSGAGYWVSPTGVRAIKKGRKALITELNDTYAASGAYYLKQAEIKVEIPTLFDMLT